MSQTDKEARPAGEIHIKNMDFRINNIHPQYSEDETARIRQELQWELYVLFQKYP